MAYNLALLDEDLEYEASQLDRSVVVPSQIRTVLQAFKDALPALFDHRAMVPKTLVFTATFVAMKATTTPSSCLRCLKTECQCRCPMRSGKHGEYNVILANPPFGEKNI